MSIPKNLDKINRLIEQLPEVYQSIYLDDKLIREGVRKNDWERLEVIKPYIKPKQTILDIGSNVGFFTIQLAKLFPQNVFLSIEANPSYAYLQKELLTQEDLKNVVLINSVVTVDWLQRASLACNYFDMTLLLSVLHHMSNASDFLTEVSKISRSLLIEMPHSEESGVCGKDVIREQLNIDKLSIVKPEFNQLDYKASTHCDAHLTRSFYYANTPNYYREALFPYIDYPLQPRHYVLKSDGEKATLYKTHLNKSIDLEPGWLVYDITKIGSIIFADQDTLMSQVEQQLNYLDKQENVADICPWNLLFSAQGLIFIDCQYTPDLTSNLRYERKRDAHSIKNYLENIFKPHAQPTIIIDGVFFQLYKTGIARVWKSLLSVWAKNVVNHILVLDRAGTSPDIPGINYRISPAYNYKETEIDREMLQQICDEEGADLFISTYYTTPLSTPSVFMAYDMIPEVLGANFEEPMWREKHKGIEHASGYISISENTAVDLAKCFPDISLESITVAHCGVDSNFSPASLAEINSFKAKYGINKPYFMAVGIASSYKNAPLFFQAFNQLNSKQGFEIVCTGSGGFLPAELRNFTRELLFICCNLRMRN